MRNNVPSAKNEFKRRPQKQRRMPRSSLPSLLSYPTPVGGKGNNSRTLGLSLARKSVRRAGTVGNGRKKAR